MRRVAVGVAIAAAVLAGGTVHADGQGGDPVRWTSQAVYSTAHTGRLAQQADPISGTFRLNAQHWRCTVVGPVPVCVPVSTLSYWAVVDLGYRKHRVIGRSAITFGLIPWGAWTGKHHRMACYEQAAVLCGPWMTVPHPKNRWSAPRFYAPIGFITGGWFRFVATACFDDTCSVGFNSSVPVYCRPRREQCYFDV